MIVTLFFVGERPLQFRGGTHHVMKETAIFHDCLEGDVFDNPHAVFFRYLVAQVENNLFKIDFRWTDSSA